MKLSFHAVSQQFGEGRKVNMLGRSLSVSPPLVRVLGAENVDLDKIPELCPLLLSLVALLAWSKESMIDS
jgi:hypothetical protein